jgi:hypothetical protein
MQVLTTQPPQGPSQDLSGSQPISNGTAPVVGVKIAPAG